MNSRPPDDQEKRRKKEAARTLEADAFYLIIQQPFVAGILLRQNLIPVVDSRCPTASTDSRNIFVNPEFYLALPRAQRCFVLAHEVWHTVYLHFQRRRERDRNLFNIATDMEVNHMLLEEHFSPLEGALLPPLAWRGLNAEEIYARLEKDSLEQKPFDVHLEPTDPDSAAGDSNQVPSADVAPDEDTVVIDPDYKVDFGNHPEEKVREMVIESAIQCEKRRGTLPDHIKRIVAIFRSRKLHWKELLAQFVTSCFGGSRRWLPPNRRYIASGLYLQSRRDTRLQAVLAIDTSGSTSLDLPRFASELVNLLNSFGQYELTVICCDAQIQSVETYTADFPFDARMIQFKGGGGTSFIPVFEYMKNQPSEAQILIYFTDGYGDCPEKPPYPVMWVITPDGHKSVPWGYEIKLDRES